MMEWFDGLVFGDVLPFLGVICGVGGREPKEECEVLPFEIGKTAL